MHPMPQVRVRMVIPMFGGPIAYSLGLNMMGCLLPTNWDIMLVAKQIMCSKLCRQQQ
jgi:hypothetical protein